MWFWLGWYYKFCDFIESIAKVNCFSIAKENAGSWGADNWLENYIFA